MAKAALYVRVSTVMQLDKESRGVQKNDLIRYCEDILGIMDYEAASLHTCLSGKLTESAGISLILLKCIRNYRR